MKDKLKKTYIIMLSAAMIFTMIMALAACSKTENNDSSPTNVRPTTQPGSDMVLNAEGPSELTEGETVEYVIKVTECSLEEGLIGIDFTLEYNADLLEFASAEYAKLPSDSWEGYNREDGEGVRLFNAFDDSDDGVTPVLGDGQFEVKVTFQVKEKASSDKGTIVKLINVTGAVNDSEISMGYGTGNEIEKA